MKKSEKTWFIIKAMIVYMTLIAYSMAAVIAVLWGAQVITSPSDAVKSVGNAIAEIPVLTWIAVGLMLIVAGSFPVVRRAVIRSSNDGAIAYMLYGATTLACIDFAIRQIDGDPLVWGLLSAAVLIVGLLAMTLRRVKQYDDWYSDDQVNVQPPVDLSEMEVTGQDTKSWFSLSDILDGHEAVQPAMAQETVKTE